MKRDFTQIRLCVIVSEGFSALSLPRLVEEVVAGGADCVQLRQKGVGDARLLELALECRKVCGAALFIVNDRPDVALLSQADGVHVGQSDLPAAEVRRLVGDDLLVGVSASTLDHITAAGRDGADYLGVGCVFPTETKDVSAQGLGFVREAAQMAKIPILAIGGINHENVGSVIREGAGGVAVCSAVIGAKDPRAAAALMRAQIVSALGETGKG